MIRAGKPLSILVVLALVLSFGIVAVPQGTTEAGEPVCTCGNICVNTTGWWRDGDVFHASATPIQDAVNNATGGDTICVKDGTYHENVNVNTANLTIKSENGAANCVVNATDSTAHVFYVTASYVNITGFTVENATGSGYAGIYLGSGVSHCNISSNKATNNFYGIYLYSSSNNTLTNNTAWNNYYGIILGSSSNNTLTNNTAPNNYECGIYLYSSSNNTLTNNTASNSTYDGIYLRSSSNNNLTNNTANSNYDGIYLYSSSNNTLTNNTADDNDYDGIYLYSSSNNTLTNNTADDNDYYGIYLDSSSNNTLTNNTANSNGNYGIYLYSSSSNTLTNNTASNNDYGIYLYSSSNNTLTNNTANSNAEGIYLGSSSNNTLTNNTANSNAEGIYLDSSSSNTLRDNTVWNNTYNGIYLVSSSNNTIYNNYFDNTNNAWDNGNNTWNTTNSTGPNIAGGPYLGGNYWSDYSGSDTNGDGFGDTEIPYNCTGNIANGGDYLPLILTGATLEGHVSFISRGTAPDAKWAQPFLVRAFEPGNLTNELWNDTATTNNTGFFTITGLTPGTYDIGIKNWTCLSELETNVTLTDGNTTVVDFGTTREGDSDGDDAVAGTDFSLLAGVFNTAPAGNPNCDFDRNNAVAGIDFSLLAGNFNVAGPLYGY